MPRAFSASERAEIGRRLEEVGRDQFVTLGIRRTNVADLARAAGIAKGSFYLFHPSKEALLLALLERSRSALHAELREIADDSLLPPRERIERFVRTCLEAYARDPLLAQLRDPEEARALARSAAGDALEELQQADDAFLVELLQEWQDAGELTPLEPEAIVALVRSLRALGFEHRAVGEERFDRAVEVLAAALADYLAW